MLEQVKNNIPTEIHPEILTTHSNTASTMSNTSHSATNTQEKNIVPQESPTLTHNSLNCSTVSRQNLQLTKSNTMNNDVSI